MKLALYWTQRVIIYIDLLIFLGLAVALLINFKRLSPALKVLVFPLTILCAVGITVHILSVLSIPNTYFIHVMLFVQLIGLTLYYREVFRNTLAAPVTLLVGAVAFICFAVFYIANWNQVIWQLGGKPYFISNLLFIVYSIIFYFYTLRGTRLPYPLINAAVLIYFSATSVVFLFGDQLKEMPIQPQRMIWILNALVHLLFVLLIFADVWKTLSPARKTS